MMFTKIKSNMILLILLLILLPQLSMSESTINTATITTDTIKALPDCLHYRIVGVCFWLVCNVGCYVVTTPKVEHYLPDVVISTYPGFGKDPWVEVNKTIDAGDYYAGKAAFKALNHGMEIKSGSFNSANSNDNDVNLREVDVIGNPALAALHWGKLLKSQAKPYFPYYQSELDANEWRSGLLEQMYPQSWIPGKNDVGTFLINDWGSVFPRSGFIMQPSIAKSSAVMAYRGGSIATTHSFNHISTDLDAMPCPNKACKTTGPIKTKAPNTKWQMLLPDPQFTCHPRIEATIKPNRLKGADSKQPFSWVVWRQYEGCVSADGHYLGSVGS